jgi:hypothetical protein
MGSQDYATHFLDEVLFQDVVHIDDILLLGDTQVVMGILFSCVAHRPSNFTQIVPSSSSFLSFLANFDKGIM